MVNGGWRTGLVGVQVLLLSDTGGEEGKNDFTKLSTSPMTTTTDRIR